MNLHAQEVAEIDLVAASNQKLSMTIGKMQITTQNDLYIKCC